MNALSGPAVLLSFSPKLCPYKSLENPDEIKGKSPLGFITGWLHSSCSMQKHYLLLDSGGGDSHIPF